MIVKFMPNQYLVINIPHHLKVCDRFKCLLLEIRTYLHSYQLGLSNFPVKRKKEILEFCN